MKDFKKGGFGGGDRRGSGGDRPRRDFGGRPSFGDRRSGGGSNRPFSGGRVEMHKATCANCGKTCEVPFRPNGEKPVYCNDCFGGKSEAPRRENNFEKRDFGAKKSFPSDRAPQHSSDEVKKMIEGLSTKLDTLISLMKETKQHTPAVSKTASPTLKSMVEKAQTIKKETGKKKVVSKKKVGKKK